MPKGPLLFLPGPLVPTHWLSVPHGCARGTTTCPRRDHEAPGPGAGAARPDRPAWLRPGPSHRAGAPSRPGAPGPPRPSRYSRVGVQVFDGQLGPVQAAVIAQRHGGSGRHRARARARAACTGGRARLEASPPPAGHGSRRVSGCAALRYAAPRRPLAGASEDAGADAGEGVDAGEDVGAGADATAGAGADADAATRRPNVGPLCLGRAGISPATATAPAGRGHAAAPHWSGRGT